MQTVTETFAALKAADDALDAKLAADASRPGETVERVARALLARRAGESGYYDRLKAGTDAFCRDELEDIHADARAAIEATRAALPVAALLGDSDYSAGYADGVAACHAALKGGDVP